MWYHVISGRKVFLAAPPTPANLAAFEEWSSSGKQASSGPSGRSCRKRTMACKPQMCRRLLVLPVLQRPAVLPPQPRPEPPPPPPPPPTRCPCCCRPAAGWATASPAWCASQWGQATHWCCPAPGLTRCPPQKPPWPSVRGACRRRRRCCCCRARRCLSSMPASGQCSWAQRPPK